MKPEVTIRAGLPSDAEARAIIDSARRLRADTLAGLARALWLRVGGRAEAAQAGVLPHARA